MATVFDVAAYILNEQGEMSALKLQKLVYYAQAWSLVWDEEPIFKDRIEAWANGPVCPRLYKEHRGQFRVSRKSLSKGDARALVQAQCETLDAVLKFYGKRDPAWLSNLTHAEDPWKRARKGLEPGERGGAEITRISMQEYYSGLRT